MSHYDMKSLLEGKCKDLPVSMLVTRIFQSNEGLWNEIEPYMLPPGKEGSRPFDHMAVVVELRKADSEGLLDTYTGRMIFDGFIKSIRKLGLRVQHGRVTGLLEHKAGDNGPLGDSDPSVE